MSYTGSVKVKVLVAALVAVLLGSCPCLASLAAAAAEEAHACCPATQQDHGSDCCLRAPAPDDVSFIAPQLVVVGLAQASPAEPVTLEAFLIDAASLSPPDTPPLRRSPSRAPPALA